MLEEITAIASFILDNLLHIWPYLLITIPLAVAIHLSGISKYIRRAFCARPIVAIFLATVVGAFSPFCSCTVIPVIASLLVGGVPLAPVMSFWLASPSMDPEIFFLSVATIGWELALWRLGAALVLSLAAGLITHVIVQRGWLGQEFLRQQMATDVPTTWTALKRGWRRLRQYRSHTPPQPAAAGRGQLAGPEGCCGSVAEVMLINRQERAPALATCCEGAAVANGSAGSTLALPIIPLLQQQPTMAAPAVGASCGCGSTEATSYSTQPISHRLLQQQPTLAAPAEGAGCGCGSAEATSCNAQPISLQRRLLNETWSITTMVVKYMILAFFLEAVIIRYVPVSWVAGVLGENNSWSILTAALIGVPVYVTTLGSLGMVAGFLAKGASPAAVLAFLIAGPTTTIPAMAAVWGVASRRVFVLYVSFVLIGAVASGVLYLAFAPVLRALVLQFQASL